MAVRGKECDDGDGEGQGEEKQEEEEKVEIRERTEGWWGPGVLILVSGRGAAASYCSASPTGEQPMRECVCAVWSVQAMR